MKTLSIFIFSILISVTVFAQDFNQSRRMITVQGSAEMEYTPDEFEVLVTLQEYESRGIKKDINTIRNDFFQRMVKAGLSEKDITLYNFSGSDAIDRFWTKKSKNKDLQLRASANYLIKLKSIDQVNSLVDNLDDDATTNFRIIKVGHSRIEEYKNTLRLQALENAKQKAILLATKLNEQVGQVLQINEPYEQHTGYIGDGVGRMRDMEVAAAPAITQETRIMGPVMQIDFRKIKLRFDAHVIFGLK